MESLTSYLDTFEAGTSKRFNVWLIIIGETQGIELDCESPCADDAIVSVEALKDMSLKWRPIKVEELSADDWADEFNTLLQNPPEDDDFLKAPDGEQIKLHITLSSGSPPFIYTFAYLPKIVGCRLQWFAQGMSNKVNSGIKLILLPNSRDDVIRKFGIPKDRIVAARTIRVVRKSTSGQSLLGEVVEW